MTTENLMDNAENEEQSSMQGKEEKKSDHRLDWWRDARFGMFIHWGLYSELAGYWGDEQSGAYAEHIQLKAKIPVKEYEKVADRFSPFRFSAKEWVALAKSAGMKYLVVTAKHHEGFAMYDSKISPYNIINTPFGRDPMTELFDECRKEGIMPCFYYSHAMDWHHPDGQGNTLDYPDNIGAYDPPESWLGNPDKSSRYERYLDELCFPQLRELLTNYGKVGLIWFDCGHKLTDEQGQRFVDFVRSLQPDCLINRRVCHSGFGDYENTSDNQVAVRISANDWESISTLNNSWGYREQDKDFKSHAELMRLFVGAVAGNGNFLLNIGPKGDGSIDDVSTGLLSGIGHWMDKNSASIYGTTASPIGKLSYGYCTLKEKENKLFLHVFDYPSDGLLTVPGVRNNITAAYFLAEPSHKIHIARINELDIMLTLPSTPIDDTDTVIVLEYEGKLDAYAKRLLLSNHENRFNAFDGDILGSRLRLDTGKRFHDTVKDWSDCDDRIQWRFRVNAAKIYAVSVEYACSENEGGEYTVNINGCGIDHNIQAAAEDTGGSYVFRIDSCGSLHLEPGEYVLTVKPVKITKAELMHLRNIILSRVE